MIFAHTAFAEATRTKEPKQDTLMKMKSKFLRKLNLGSGFAFVLAVAAWLPGTGCATHGDPGTGMKPMKAGEHSVMPEQKP